MSGNGMVSRDGWVGKHHFDGQRSNGFLSIGKADPTETACLCLEVRCLWKMSDGHGTRYGTKLVKCVTKSLRL